jgi:hypothetical protein
MSGDLEPCPIKQKKAFAFLDQHHRHHEPPAGYLWACGLMNGDGVLVGVASVGRPVARALDDGFTCEITRLCTVGVDNACSFLYAAARREAIERGFRRGLTYILASEGGASLRASGWLKLWDVKGRSWNTPSRPREDKHPTCDKTAYGWGAWRELQAHAK